MIFNPQPVSVMADITDQTVPEKQAAVMECQIRINYPEITPTWYKDTLKLENSHKYEISSDGDHHCLKISSCQPSDQGNYRVVCGPHISSARLTVTGKSLKMLSCLQDTSSVCHHTHLHVVFRDGFRDSTTGNQPNAVLFVSCLCFFL